jgi:hypothetical protein
MMLTAGVDRAMADQSRALQHPSNSGDSTGLTPAFNQTEFNNPSRETALYNSLRDLGMTDEQILKIQQQDQQLKQKHEERQLAKKITKNSDDYLDGLSKLFEEESSEVKGSAENRQLSEQVSQSTKEVHQGEQDKGKELLKPEEKKIASLPARKEVVKANRKMLERVWSSLSRRELAADTTSVVFVRGLNGGIGVSNGSDQGQTCNNNKGYWQDARQFLSNRGITDLRTIGIYNGDSDCDAYLHDKTKSYESKCTGFHADAKVDGTNNEKLEHLSCLLAWYLHDTFGQSNNNVVLVGHCMGGLIMREAMSQVQQQEPHFPTTIGHVTDAITFETPHGGITGSSNIAGLACGSCTQLNEMMQGSGFISELSQNPQTSGGFTSWTVIGSECDSYVDPHSATDMRASHAIVYANTYAFEDWCKDHNAIITDTSATQDAQLYYCDKSDPDKSPCGTDYNQWKNTEEGPHALLAMYDAINNKLP